jgi:hypothetical protein
MSDPQALKAAAFLVQALELDDDPVALAGDVVSLKRDANAGISTIELDSSVGAAPFLIYDYQLFVRNDDGLDGQTLFDSDLHTLERAAEADAPGPRILAHAIAGDEAFILATTPAVHRALTGHGSTSGLEATEADLVPGAQTVAVRTDAANDLLRLLREADDAALRWLRAIHAEGKVDTDTGGFLEFNESEAALALYVLDDRSIQNLLQALNLFVASAKSQAENALGSQSGEDS